MKREKMTRRARYGIMAALIAGAFSIMPAVQAMPTGGNPTAGVGIETNGAIMDITSTEGNNLITWQSFSVAANEQVRFDANNYLNYVRGSNPSEILGKITGGGDIYLVNPNGIVVGDGAKIDVGNLHLSTAKVDAGNLNTFTAAQSALASAVSFSGDVVNKGTLNAGAITVQGENITFKNVADVTATTVNLSAVAKAEVTAVKASGEIHLGYKDVDGDYTTIEEPALTNWTVNGASVDKYMMVESAVDLQNINTNLTGKYMLAKDIVLEAPGTNDSNFEPIGNDSNPFIGKFDGNGYTVANLVINKPNQDYVGLFGRVSKNWSTGQTGRVENIGVINSSIVGKDYVGGVAGCLNSLNVIMRNVYNAGDVSGRTYVGGVVGRYGESAVLASAYNTGTVTGNNYVAGVAGLSTGGEPIIYCYNTGDITGGDHVSGIWEGSTSYSYNTGTITGVNYVGGICGDAGGRTITSVYNSGDVKGTGDYVGGLYGKAEVIHNGPVPSGYYYNSYNVGTVTGNGEHVGSATGAFITSDETLYSNRIQEVYYASDTVSGSSNNIGTEKTLTELTNPETFNASWNMSEDGAAESGWRIYPGYTTPLLTAFMKPMEVSDYTLSSAYTGEAILVGQGVSGLVTVRNVGEYNFTDLLSLYSNQQGYNIHIAEGTTNLKYTVTPATLTVTAAAANKVYDGQSAIEANAGSYSVSGLLAGDTYTNPVIAFADKNIGVDKAISISGGTLSDGNNGANYAVTYVGSKGTITAKELTLAANAVNVTKVYDGTTAVNDQAKFTVTGMVTGDDVYLNKSNITVAYPSANAGNYELTFTSNGAVTLAGADAGNYNLTGTLNDLAGTGKITPRELTVAFGNTTKEYNGLFAATPGVATFTGLVEGDTVSLSDTVQATYANKGAGTWDVNYSGLSLTGTSAGNYTIAGTAVGTGTITPKALTVSFGDTARDYNGTTTATAGVATLTGVLEGDAVSLANGFTAQYDSKNVGDRTVTYSGLSLTGDSAANYTIAASAQGAGSIQAVPVTFKADDYTKLYDGTTSAPGATFSVSEGSLFGTDRAGDGVFAFEDSTAGTGKLLLLSGVTIADGNEGQNYLVSYLPSTNSSITQISPLMLNAVAVANSSAEGDGELKRRALAEGLTLNNYRQLSGLASSGMNTPVAMSFEDILTMWSVSE